MTHPVVGLASAVIRAAYANVRVAYANVRAVWANVRVAHANVRAVWANVRAAYANVRVAYANVSAAYANVRVAYANVSAAHGVVSAAALARGRGGAPIPPRHASLASAIRSCPLLSVFVFHKSLRPARAALRPHRRDAGRNTLNRIKADTTNDKRIE
ncbi:MAG: hypothetical protein ACHQSE_14675 [Gemmatimonadales bacterium]